MSKFGEDLVASLGQAVEHARGKKAPGMRVTVVEHRPKEVMEAVAEPAA